MGYSKGMKYDENTLKSCIIKYNAKLDGIYANTTRESIISFICSCENANKKKFREIYNSGAYCKGCIKKIRYEKRTSTNLKIYGTEHATQTVEVKDKTKKTNLEKYGVEYYLQSINCKDKKKITNLKKYGVEHATQTDEVKYKTKNTNLEKYGVEYPIKLEEIKKKVKATNLENFGVEYPMKSKEFRDKVKLSNLKKYGVENTFQYEHFKDKIKDTNIKKYGVEYAIQNPKIFEKQLINSYKKKDVITPSGKVITLQGYEPQAYKILLETYTEEEILNSRTDVPEIWWFDDKDKRHRYFVDFYVPKDNLIIEVKSKRTYLLGKDKIEKTLQASNEAGYNIELWIMDEKGNIVEKIVKQVNTTIKNGNSKEI